MANFSVQQIIMKSADVIVIGGGHAGCEAAAASARLGRITGRVDVEDLLDVIFRDFCIGK